MEKLQKAVSNAANSAKTVTKTREVTIHEDSVIQGPATPFSWTCSHYRVTSLLANNGQGGHGPKGFQVYLENGDKTAFFGSKENFEQSFEDIPLEGVQMISIKSSDAYIKELQFISPTHTITVNAGGSYHDLERRDFPLAKNECIIGLFGESYSNVDSTTYGCFKRLGFIFGKHQ